MGGGGRRFKEVLKSEHYLKQSEKSVKDVEPVLEAISVENKEIVL